MFRLIFRYCLVYDAVISEVIYARDKWLRRGGKIFPNRATLHIVALRKEDYGRALEWWDHGKCQVAFKRNYQIFHLSGCPSATLSVRPCSFIQVN